MLGTAGVRPGWLRGWRSSSGEGDNVSCFSGRGSGAAMPTLRRTWKTRQYAVEVRKRISEAPRINPITIYIPGVLCGCRGLV